MTPRPATERLVDAALELVDGRNARVVDVGTGSGALAIAIAAAAPNVRVWAIDASRDAVALARRNVQRHGLTGRITVSHGDLLGPVAGPLDLVVANLPYLPTGEAALFPDVAGEPNEAVFAAGDGLEPYRRLLRACAFRLSPDGAVAIQLHRRVLTAHREELPLLRAEIERVQKAAAASSVSQLRQAA
jgi:release factor glutamine methyltransferase